MFFYPTDISHFHSFGCHLGSKLGSLLQKRDPDRCDQTSHNNHLCFFTKQALSIFIPFAVTWGPDLDRCGKSAILANAIKIDIKSLMLFFTKQAFPMFIPLALTWPPNLDPCCKSAILSAAIEISIKIAYGFFT